MAQIFAVKSMMSGLNNQRMGLVGLITYAARHKAKVVLPRETVDFSPGSKISPSDYKAIPFNEVFDEDILLGSMVGEYITNDEPTDVIGLDKCFAEGAAILTEARTQDTPIHRLSREALLSLEPTSEIRDLANAIVDWLPPNTYALQLRIERDWQEYLTKKFGASEIDTNEEFLTATASKIALKIKKSDLFPYAIWGCCDEFDLTVPLDEIRRDFNHHGMNIMFKTDLPNHLDYPENRIKRAFLEFAVCRQLTGYIGLSRSSFSQTLWLDNIWKGNNNPHYLYNTPHKYITRR